MMPNYLVRFLLAGLLALFLSPLRAQQPECFPEEVIPDNYFPNVRLETTLGDIVIELDRRRAPVTANNFLRYVLAGAYDGTIFHRVVPGFVVQGGGYTETIEERELFPPIINESGNGLQNMPMSVAMARFDEPHSATSQFFFNLGANASLDPNPRSWGYAVFAQVVSGQEVVTRIGSVETGYHQMLDSDEVPLTPVKILSATVLEAPH